MDITNAAQYGPKPPLGDLVAGQPVMVRRSPNDMRRRKVEDRYIPARVVKAARVWVDLERAVPASTLGYQTWRMRMDTQDEATQYSGSNASFMTMAQYEWQIAREWALGVLTEQGISLDRDSPWWDRGVELAELISKAVDTSQ